jgi:DUF1680 family protein
MAITRRAFVEITVRAGASITAWRFMAPSWLLASDQENQVLPAPTVDWVAATPATAYRAYRSKPAAKADTTTWVQVDLGARQLIEDVTLYPANERLYPGRDEHFAGEGFPVRFKIEASDTPDFRAARLIADKTAADYPNPHGEILRFAAHGVTGRYLRLTATRLRAVKEGDYYLAMSKLDVFSGGKGVSTRRPVTADAQYGNDNDVAQVTRPNRPGGEATLTDHAENVIPASRWKPAAYKAQVPLRGVSLEGGIFQTAMENNIRYLLESYSTDELLRQFRERAGIPNPPGLPKPKTKFWEEDLAGSNAGRFLMGAGNTLRWIEHPELRRRVNAVVDGIAECRQPNGYIMAYPEDTIFYSERGAYTRAWLTHGLIDAGFGGNRKAFELLRGYYDWFNQCPYLPQLLRFAVQGGQGMIANTRLYFTPMGKPADIQVIQRYFQEDYWLEQLSAREDRAVWQYPYDRPHCYLLTDFEAYMDLYLATGEPRYLRAMLGGWELFHNKWENVGGSIAIIEYIECPPQSYLLHKKLGELCGSAFWVFFNQRFHMLNPDEEKYVSEIEKSIYNVALANQDGSRGIRYHAVLSDRKDASTQINTCCEGQGTRLIGSLPEHIYSLAADGIYVNLFEPSTITWSQSGKTLRLRTTTKFPFQPDVQMSFSANAAVRTTIRIRVPSWAASEMPIKVNGSVAATGKPGSYVNLDRTWSDGDTLFFSLPMAFRLTRYTGTDQIPDHQRYALEYGPILLAAVGSAEVWLQVRGGHRPEDLLKRLRAKPAEPLHFTVEGNPAIEYMPYWQVTDQPFTCFPVIEIGELD